jgi:hypothetical protein
MLCVNFVFGVVMLCHCEQCADVSKMHSTSTFRFELRSSELLSVYMAF